MEPARWDALLRTAAGEFAEAGYEGASLNRIITSCGLSKSSFYYFVDSKQQLFEAVLSEFGPALLRLMDVPDPQGLSHDFWGTVSGIVDRLVSAGEQDEIYFLLGRMWYLPGAPSGADATLTRDIAAVHRWVHEALQTGRQTGAVRDDLPLLLQARLLIATMSVFDEWSVQHRGVDDVPATDLARAQLEAVRRLLE